MIPSPVHCATVLPYRCTTAAQQSASSAMISRNRSAPTAAAMSIECTTSANRTVTCLYSAGFAAEVTGTPHSLQNLAFSFSSVPHDPHNSPAAVISRASPLSFHVNIVSPLASQHVPYRQCDVYGHTSDDAARAAIDGLTGALGLCQVCSVLDKLLR